MTQKTDKKIISNGHVIEVYEYEFPCQHGFAGNGGRRKKEEEESERSEEIRATSCRAARNRLRRLAVANFTNHSKFITLTFKRNEKDVQSANNSFKKFIQRLRYRYGRFKYIAVIEFQERGAVHYHMMSDLPYIKNKELRDLWDQGHVKINDIKHVDNVGAYMIKYMLKDLKDPRLKGQKSYLSSKGLDKPIEIRGEGADEMIRVYDLEKKEKVFTSSYESEHNGKITYSEYNLKRS